MYELEIDVTSLPSFGLPMSTGPPSAALTALGVASREAMTAPRPPRAAARTARRERGVEVSTDMSLDPSQNRPAPPAARQLLITVSVNYDRPPGGERLGRPARARDPLTEPNHWCQPATEATIERLFCVQPVGNNATTVDNRREPCGRPRPERGKAAPPGVPNVGNAKCPMNHMLRLLHNSNHYILCFPLTDPRRRRIVLRSLRSTRAASSGTPAGTRLRSANLGTRTNRSVVRGDVAATSGGDANSPTAPDRRTNSGGQTGPVDSVRREQRWPERAARRSPSWTT